MILWKFIVREMKNRPGRATLTLLSIVIGVAAVVAVNVGTETTNQACQDMYNNVAGRAAIEVVAEAEGFFPEELADSIEKISGVQAAVPSVLQWSSLRFKETTMPLWAMGIDPERDKAARDYVVQEGRFFEDKYEAMLETGFAQGMGIHVGDKVRLVTSRSGRSSLSVKEFTIVGLLSSRGAAGFREGGIVFLPLDTASYLFSKVGNVNTISVVLAGKADETAVAQSLRSQLPPGMIVRPPRERARLSQETIEKVRKGLDFSYVMILALAFFMILNTFLMNVGERRRQLAVLRAIGATRRQLIRMLLMEGLVMGLVGTALGILAGLGGAFLLTQSMGKIYAASMPSLRITPAPFIFAALLGPSVSLFAMFIPAWIAGKVSPLEGMRFIASEGYRRVSLSYVIVAVVVFVVTGALMTASITGYLPVQAMIVLGMIFTAAFLLLVPMILGPMAWFIATLLRPMLGTEGRIAHRQVLRRRVRTTLTVGILYLAVSTAISLGTNILDNVDDVHSWVRKTFIGDFFVRIMYQDMTTGLSAKMPESMADDLRAVDGVASVGSFGQVTGTVQAPNTKEGKFGAIVFFSDFSGKSDLPLDIKGGDIGEVRKNLAAGGVVLGTVLAHRLGVKVGDEVTLETREGPKPLKVAGTATAYIMGGMIVYMERETARQLLHVEGVDCFFIDAAPGKLATVQEGLQKFCTAQGLLLQSSAQVRKRVDDMTRGVIAGLWGLLVLGLVVGAFAIANTLTMNVLEQTRELALLRVVAMTRWQVRKTIFSQAMIIGLIGLVFGTIGGVSGAYVMNLSTIPLLGHAPDFALHPSLMFVCFGVGLAVILAAAWLPAERAARLNLLIALQYE